MGTLGYGYGFQVAVPEQHRTRFHSVTGMRGYAGTGVTGMRGYAGTGVTGMRGYASTGIPVR
jgi:hypothetical protein